MDRKPVDSNAIKALQEMKMEIAKELGVTDTFTTDNKLDPVTNIFTAGPVGGLMTRKLVEMGEKELMDEE
ncbi:small, acid-soluble spore protein, alpha/beta type [Clostridium sp. Cult2]|uniref:small, acid-soluble spore protein, alpha/beta type n=1 Tax=Clostridium sp. Cult2 TaxID=2079003 RepID=UPI001F1671B5